MSLTTLALANHFPQLPILYVNISLNLLPFQLDPQHAAQVRQEAYFGGSERLPRPGFVRVEVGEDGGKAEVVHDYVGGCR